MPRTDLTIGGPGSYVPSKIGCTCCGEELKTFPIRVEGTEWAFCSELCRDAHQVEHELSILNILDEMGHRLRSGEAALPKGMVVKDIKFDDPTPHDLANNILTAKVLVGPPPLPDDFTEISFELSEDVVLDDDEAAG